MAPQRGPEGREGPAGREGVAGREGLPGESGIPGAQGVEGPRGDTGPLPRSVRIAFIALTAVFVIVLGAIGIFASENRVRANEGREAHNALCVIKANFQVRRDRTVQFLKDNPGPTILGIDRAEFQKSLEDTKETLRALATLICDPPAKPTTTERIVRP